MRCVSSRFLTAAPRLSAASISSCARRNDIDFSLRSRAASMTQRIASVWRRVDRTSTGTWYVAPPTRRDFNSTTGFTLSSPVERISIAFAPFFPVFSLMRASPPPLPADIARRLVAVRQAYGADISAGRIRLLRRRRIDAITDAARLGGCPKRRYLCFLCLRPARLPDELARGRHASLISKILRRARSSIRARDLRLEEDRAACVRRPGIS